MLKTIIRKFLEAFLEENDLCSVRSPLRICPIGAYSDYQGGKVTGLTIDTRSYIHGAVQALQEDYVLKVELNAIMSGKLPIGGLSSSAAVTTPYLMALCDVNDIEFTKNDLIKYCHWVETEFIGLKNGILDQSANILSLDNQLMVMDCQEWEHEMISKGEEFPEFEVVVVYSRITKNLMGTDFNNRVDEVRVAGWMLQNLSGFPLTKHGDVRLREIPKEAYETHKEKLLSRFRKRAAHFYTEQELVEKCAEACAKGDLETFG